MTSMLFNLQMERAKEQREEVMMVMEWKEQREEVMMVIEWKEQREEVMRWFSR